MSVAPSACLMNGGVPPTALKARTGELTPPGITFFALANAASELAIDLAASDWESGMMVDLPGGDLMSSDETRQRKQTWHIAGVLIAFLFPLYAGSQSTSS